MDSSVRDLTISIDSYSSDKYYKIRGVNCLKQIQENIYCFIEEKKKRGISKPYLGINCVILPENFKELLDYYHWIDENFPEVSRINFEAPMRVDACLGNEYEQIMRNELNTDAYSWRGFRNSHIKFSEEDIVEVLDKMEELKKQKKVTFLSPTDKKEVERTFGGHGMEIKQTCKMPTHALTVLTNGDVVFCTDFPDYILGNLNNGSLEEIMNGERANKFRDIILRSGLPICTICPRYHDKGEFLINEGDNINE